MSGPVQKFSAPSRFGFAFRRDNTLSARKRLHAELKKNYPDCVFVVLERFCNAYRLPPLVQPNSVVHKTWSLGHFFYKLQKKMGYEPVCLNELYFWSIDKV
ncbi:hypothetical protein WDU94_013524 [Cyamophila willieti]